jgi:hypothetical protein
MRWIAFANAAIDFFASGGQRPEARPNLANETPTIRAASSAKVTAGLYQMAEASRAAAGTGPRPAAASSDSNVPRPRALRAESRPTPY